jgi:hypothetical protein
MNFKKNQKLLIAATGVLILACSSSGNENLTLDTEGQDSGSGSDAGPEIDSGDTDTDTDTGTGDVEVPSGLSELCHLVSESVNISGPGNSLSPDLAFIQAPESPGLLTWAHHDKKSDSAWEIQVVSFDPQPEEIDGGLDGGSVNDDLIGTITTPAAPGPVAEDPSIAARGDVLGLVWRDGRRDQSCVSSNIDDCRRDLVFFEVDVQGEPLQSDVPLQVTLDVGVFNRPAIASTSSGYVIVWIEMEAQEYQVMAVGLDTTGKTGEAYQVSGEGSVNRYDHVSVAAGSGTVAVAWATEDQQQILVQILDEDGKPTGDSVVIDEGQQSLKPRIASFGDGYVLSWSRQSGIGLEIFSGLLGSTGQLQGSPKQVTWTGETVGDLEIAADEKNIVLVWTSTKGFGGEGCAVQECNPQVFGALLDSNAKLASLPTQLSDDPNSCSGVKVAWDGDGWTAVWQVRRDMAETVFYNRMVCD